MSAPVEIAGRAIGPGEPVYVIAEAGVNHDGDVDRALALVDAAAAAGADAVKFQTFDPAALASDGAPLAEYQQGRVEAESQRAMLDRLALGEDDFRRLAGHARDRGVAFLSTPFDEGSAELLERLGVPAFKVGSGELTNLPLLASLARRGRPLLVSTGMATIDEVGAAVRAVREAGSPPLVLLHCLSAYPAPADQANLRAIGTLREAFGVPVGWSDHCLELEPTLAAVALGAVVVERHLTLDRTAAGPDHSMSSEPPELAELIRRIRVVEAALGDGVKRPQQAELDTRAVARRSLVATRDLAAGERINAGDVAIKRPGGGLEPRELERLVGARLALAVRRDEPFAERHLASDG
ncbi:MAG: N,N-diacetyllegionaminate synthase [Thermoleophilaceae bacterium]|nr:N,N-diacetyllegionaminate synthase [Thermoleophilaceae bacterium]